MIDEFLETLGWLVAHSTEVNRGLVCDYPNNKLAGTGGLMKELAKIISDILRL